LQYEKHSVIIRVLIKAKEPTVKTKTIAARVEATNTNGFEHWVYIKYTGKNDTDGAPRCDVCHSHLFMGPGSQVYCDNLDQSHHQHKVAQGFVKTATAA